MGEVRTCTIESRKEKAGGFFSCYGLHSRALLNPLEAGYLSYYVITLAGTPNESCGNLSALWMAPSPTTIYQLAPHLTQSTPSLNTHTHIRNLITASVDRLQDMDRACNGIPMLNTRLVFFVIWGDHTLSQIAQRETTVDYVNLFLFLPRLALSITTAFLGLSCLKTFIF